MQKKNYYPLFATPCNTDGGVGDLSAADALIVITVLNKSLFLILTILKGKLLPRALSCCQIFSKISAAAGEAGTAFPAQALISSAVEHLDLQGSDLTATGRAAAHRGKAGKATA